MNGRFYRCVDSMLLLFPTFAAAQCPDSDFIIPHRTWSTAGAPWVEGDIAIAGDRMVAIGDLPCHQP